jgi:ABC-type multidrug transport system fused ATPase/permease subunit
MNQSDDAILKAVAAEERELLRAIGEEQPFISQSLRLFRGPNGWVNSIVMVAQTLAFLASIWAGWHFFQASTVLEALQWGLPATVLVLMSLILKLSLWPVMQVNRLMLQIKRVEILLAGHERER